MKKSTLLNCVVCYNRYYYLKNLLDSMQEYFRIGDTLVINDGSENQQLLDYLVELKSKDFFVIHQPHEEHKQWLFGGLYSAMNKGIEFALEYGYEYINFVQDDMQFVWNDPQFMNKVTNIFENLPEAAQVSYHFFKKIMRTRVEKRIEYYPEASCYHFRPFTISDLGIIPISFIKKTGFRVTGSEAERNDELYSKGYKRFNISTPSLAWIPWPTTFRKQNASGEVIQPPQKYYIKPLDDAQIKRLVSQTFEILPCHEDYCFPWGWRCLSPYWFTSPNIREYVAWLLRSLQDGEPIFPHFVDN